MDLDLTAAPVILLDGSDCVGKTTCIRSMQSLIPKHNQIKLSGDPKNRPDNNYMRDVYLASTMLFHATPDNTWLIDRYTPSERVYGKIYRNLQPNQMTHLDWAEEELARKRNAHYFLLTLPAAILEERLARKRREFPNEDHGSVESLMKIQDHYCDDLRNVRFKNKWIVNAANPLSDVVVNILIASGLVPSCLVNSEVIQRS